MFQISTKFRFAILCCAMTLWACEGSISQVGTSELQPPVKVKNNGTKVDETNNTVLLDGPVLGRAEGRRLAPSEVEATIADLLIELNTTTSATAVPLPPPDILGNFSNSGNSRNFTYDQIANLMDWTESVSELLVVDIDTTLGCSPGVAWDTCTSEFASDISRIVWRRPIKSEELVRFEKIYTDVVAQSTPMDGVRALIEFALMSPEFWYLSNTVGEDGESHDSHAIAERLSYFIWGTMPDKTLRALADRDELQTRAQVRAQADLMIGDQRAGKMIARFHREWMHVSSAFDLQKNPDLYPNFTAEMAIDYETEFNQFVRQIVLEQGSMADLMGSQYGFVNQRLEPLFGLDPESSGNDDWLWRDLGSQRAGIFLRPLSLASTAGAGESLLIQRGNAIVKQALCRTLIFNDDFTSDAVVIPDGATSGKLAGVENRASKPKCSSCHNVIDPIGVTFETYDAIGAWRTQYPDGVAIKTTGSIALPDEVGFTDAANLVTQLGDVSEFKTCYASKWVEWITGYPVDATERSEVAELAEALTIRDLILNTTTSDLFRKRKEIP